MHQYELTDPVELLVTYGCLYTRGMYTHDMYTRGMYPRGMYPRGMYTHGMHINGIQIFWQIWRIFLANSLWFFYNFLDKC